MTAYTITAVPALIGLVFCVMAVAPSLRTWKKKR